MLIIAMNIRIIFMRDLSENIHMETASVNKEVSGGSFKRKMKRFFYWLCAIVILFIGINIYFKYFYTFSEGYRAGLLQKFSHKGNIFKTYEGEIILSSVSSSNEVALASEKFIFSVINKDIVRQLDTLQGSKVIVHYFQKKRPVFWRGDSEYLVDSIKLKK
jgi:hypothetical protein